MATTNYNFTTVNASEPVHPNAIDNMNASLGQIDGKIKELDLQNFKKSLLTAIGDLVYASAVGVPARLGIGTENQILQVGVDGVPIWGNLPEPPEIPEIPEQMVLTGIELPVADVTYRGKLFTLFGDTEVSDIPYVCIKDETDEYVWKELSLVAPV